MSYLDMAHDGGYRGEEAEFIARQLEEEDRVRQEYEYAKYEAEMYELYMKELRDKEDLRQSES